MEPEVFVDIVREALGLVALLVSASIVPSLCVGLCVSIFQAATSINEQTLAYFIPAGQQPCRSCNKLNAGGR